MTPRRYVGWLLLFAPPMWGDATLRYHTGGTATTAQLEQALGGMQDIVVRIKGNKAYSSEGNLTSIIDLMTRDAIVIDAAHKRFAILLAGQYFEPMKIAVPAMPAEAREFFASMKANIESRNTGKTGSIQGIQAEEREFVLTLNIAIPGGPPTPLPFMKMIVKVWTAKPEETQRVPALQEFKNYMASAKSALNPSEMVKQVVGGLPGVGDKLGQMIEELNKTGGMALRTNTEIEMPFAALVSQQTPQQAGQALPAGDPSGPLMLMNQELVELSSDPIDDVIFQIPTDYQQTSVEQILKATVSAASPPQFKQ